MVRSDDVRSGFSHRKLATRLGVVFGHPQYKPFFDPLARVRNLKKILSEPAEEYGKKVAGKRRKLKIPKGTELTSKLPLEEVLYEDYRVKPKAFLPESVAEILPDEPQPEKLQALGIAPPKAEPISDEQKINQLVGLQAYPSDPNCKC